MKKLFSLLALFLVFGSLAAFAVDNGLPTPVPSGDDPETAGFLRLTVTKGGQPLASYPCVLTQKVPFKRIEHGSVVATGTRIVTKKGVTNKNGKWVVKTGIIDHLPFTLEVGNEDNPKMEYYKTVRIIEGKSDPTADGMAITVAFPTDKPRFVMTKLGDGERCRCSMELRPAKDLDLKKFVVEDENGNRIKLNRIASGTYLEFCVPNPEKGEPADDYSVKVLQNMGMGGTPAAVIWKNIYNWNFKVGGEDVRKSTVVTVTAPKVKKANEN
ncbi:MAG: hypothetical protein HQM10_04245 [Candidatus Riflebacteria bacterium]|nr:hypothetical protein [Candidatus Riflebacteria bacterium]